MSGAPSEGLRVAVLGASGYVGGELLRLLLAHPAVSDIQAAAGRSAGQFAHMLHPNLRCYAPMRLVTADELQACDLIFTALPHGQAAGQSDRLRELAPQIIDCSADLRLDTPARYETWYGEAHPAPALLDEAVYGLPEVHREASRSATLVIGVGCNATAVNLALLPLVRAGLLDTALPITAEVKVGSSEAGRSASESGQHAERSGVVRSYAPIGHRHTAEVQMTTGLKGVHLSITAVELVRGAQATCQAFTREVLDEKELWRAYRSFANDEPFVRVVHERRGIFRQPEPKILSGSNFAEIGWAYDSSTRRIVALSAIDNLMKGAAGTAVQCMNLMCGLEETAGLGFPGLHPA